ncbi:MAG: hypothetical protein JWN98_1999 [Abditibacteriota bacterium]|nr:hypothetical protein [Abditibacteriota bacterium]
MRHRTDYRKHFGCTRARCGIVTAPPAALVVALAALVALPSAVRADCWPPLNAVEERQSNPVKIGEETFTTGYYSWSLEGYHVDSLHCEKTINEGPRQWSAIVGLGGNEPIGPRVMVDGKPVESSSQSTSSTSAARARQKTAPVPTWPSLPTLPPTPSLPTISTLLPPPTLPNVAPVSDLAPLAPLNTAMLPTIPDLPQLSPIPDAR